MTLAAPASRSNGALSDIAVPQKPLASRARGWLLWLTIAALLAWSWGPTEMHKIGHLFTDWRNMAEFGSGFLRPNFQRLATPTPGRWSRRCRSPSGARRWRCSSASRSPSWARPTYARSGSCSRFGGMMDSFRAINEIVFALLFVVAVGLGPLAGVLALAVHNIGIVAKLFSEAVEAIDPRPVEGIRATGAGRLQEVIFGVVPQVMPLWSSYTLYRFETNVRSATVLGIVGAGGIGHSLYENIRSFHYSETAAIIIIVVLTVMLIDILSARIRKVLV